MKILLAGKKERGIGCFNTLIANKYEIVGVIGTDSKDELVIKAKDGNLPIFQPENINDSDLINKLKKLSPDLTILAGYGQIVGQEFIDIAPKGCINLHAGKLPEYRGSSPLNWALINGEKNITLTIIKVDTGVDTGNILCERKFNISIDDTITDLHKIANKEFPEMLIDTIKCIQNGGVIERKQDNSLASYYPLRFPEDGLFFFDRLTAEQIHNRMRALTHPYHCAFTYLNGRKILMIKSKLTKTNYYGESGRIYKINDNGLLVCASDKCLWIKEAVFEENKKNIFEVVKRYDKFDTLQDLIVKYDSRTK